MSKDLLSLGTALWNSADAMRSKMNASEYMNYLLGLVFFQTSFRPSIKNG